MCSKIIAIKLYRASFEATVTTIAAAATMAISHSTPFKPCFPPPFWVFPSSLRRPRFFCSTAANQWEDPPIYHMRQRADLTRYNDMHSLSQRKITSLMECEEPAALRVTSKGGSPWHRETMRVRNSKMGYTQALSDSKMAPVKNERLKSHQHRPAEEKRIKELDNDSARRDLNSSGVSLQNQLNNSLVSQNGNVVGEKPAVDDCNQSLGAVQVDHSANGLSSARADNMLFQEINGQNQKADLADRKQFLQDARMAPAKNAAVKSHQHRPAEKKRIKKLDNDSARRDLNSSGVSLQNELNNSLVSQNGNVVGEKPAVDDCNQFLGAVQVDHSANGLSSARADDMLFQEINGQNRKADLADSKQFLQDTQMAPAKNATVKSHQHRPAEKKRIKKLDNDSARRDLNSCGVPLQNKLNNILVSQNGNAVREKPAVDDCNQSLGAVQVDNSANGLSSVGADDMLFQEINGQNQKADFAVCKQFLQDTQMAPAKNVTLKSRQHRPAEKKRIKKLDNDSARRSLNSSGVPLQNQLNNILLSQNGNAVCENPAVDDCKQSLGSVQVDHSANDLSSAGADDMLFQEINGQNQKADLADCKQFLQDTQMDDQGKLRWKLCSIFDKVVIVDSVAIARKVVHKLMNEYRHLIHACDTEVAQIDVKQETPVNHGEIICFSIYSGNEVDYGNGKSCIWVDVLDGGGKDILAVFTPFFEDSSIKKVWHNYSFDCHVIENYGINLSGFHADTMHMARLWDSSRRTEGGYSLEALTRDPKVMNGSKMCRNEDLIGKISMKTIFGRRKMKKDGSMGKIVTLPPVVELQKEERDPWICYSALDSMSTLKLYDSMRSKLSQKEWRMNGQYRGTMLNFYESYWQPFGKLLVQMEAEGMLVDRSYLAQVEKVAIVEQQIAADRFRNWASKYCPDARYMNVGSDTQLRQLFFGGICNRKDHNECLPTEKKFKISNVANLIEVGKKLPKKTRDITLHKIGSQLKTDLYTATGWPSVSGDALKAISGKVSAKYDFSSDASELELIDDPQNSKRKDVDISAYGTAYAAFNGGQEGIEACHAIAALCEVCSIDSLISNFILPLQGSHVSGKNGRIHCSLNINTETGRLSARRPNLQNQPALEKDRYKIRQAFIATPGNSLIVADYGQLELRILAHLADCKSMKEAFIAGGDFHSRTAMNMYPYIREAVERNDVLLEWHPQPGQEKPPVPLLKDAFGAERRKAKMLNFSIAYGKTPMGLAKDWKVSVKEARETVDLWYRERQEVLKWQQARKKEAIRYGCVHTLLGRARRFPPVDQASPPQRGHIERAAINTPVQGSAADVAMCAMLEIDSNVHLKELGWKLLLQVHDEVILEGPSESAEVAKAIVVECMANPFNGRNILTVELAVDAKCAQNWYAAK